MTCPSCLDGLLPTGSATSCGRPAWQSRMRLPCISYHRYMGKRVHFYFDAAGLDLLFQHGDTVSSVAEGPCTDLAFDGSVLFHSLDVGESGRKRLFFGEETSAGE